MYRADGPGEMRPVGETEFVAGIAAMSDSGIYGPTRVAAGIVGFADLTLGDRVEPVLQAHIRAGGGRFRGVRHSAAWDASADHRQQRGRHGPARHAGAPDFRAGLARLTALGLSLDAWVFHPQLADAIDLARALPDANIIVGHCGGPLGYGPYAGKRDEVFAAWKARIPELADVPERDDEARRHDDAAGRLRLRRAGRAALLRRAGRATGGRTSSRASSGSAPTAACSRATSRSTRWASATAALWNAFKRIAAGASADEKLALFSGTARRAYRLE